MYSNTLTDLLRDCFRLVYLTLSHELVACYVFSTKLVGEDKVSLGQSITFLKGKI